MAKELPYFQFEPAEYLTKDISFCTLEAQGLFINICSYYWQRECILTKDQFLKRLNRPIEFDELIKEGIIDLQENNIIIKFLDAQFINATKLSKVNSINGSKGGRPKKEKPIESENKPNGNPIESESKGIREEKRKEEEIKVNNIEIKGESLKDSTNLSPSSPKIDYDNLILFFNEHRGLMPPVKIISDSRKKRIKSILAKHSKKDLQEVILKSKVSDFMQGTNGRDWSGTFDWITTPANFIKILEGNFDNKNLQNGKSNPASATFAKNR